MMLRTHAVAVWAFGLVHSACARPLIQVEDFFDIKTQEKKAMAPAIKKAVLRAPETDFFMPKGMPKMTGMANGILDEWGDTFHGLSLSFSMSMSMSMKTSAPVSAPSPVARPTYSSPHAPSASPGYPTMHQPTYLPPTFEAPQATPVYPTTLQPASVPEYPTTPTVSDGYPSVEPPTCSNCPGQDAVLVCTRDGVGVTDSSNATTSVVFRVGYLVESSNEAAVYIGSVEQFIVAAAAVGAMQCDSGGYAFAPSVDPTSITVASIQTDQCTPTRSGAACTVWRTSFEITLGQDVDSSVASFLGYMAVQDAMGNGAMLDHVSTIHRVEYLSPSPLLPPITGVAGNASPSPGSGTSSAEGELSVNRWTLGAVLTMCVGGVIALAVWVRNRRTRNERHLHLMEDVSIATPADHSIISGRNEV